MKLWPPMLRWLRTGGRREGLRAKIISLGTASPERVVTQREAFEALGYNNPRTWKIFQNAGIAHRRVWIPPERLRTLSMDQLYDAYFEGALTLGANAARECLHDGNVGSLTFASTTQPRLLCPSMSYRLSSVLGLPSDMQHTDMIGGGCQGAAPAIHRAYDSFVSTGRPALVVCAEICSATYFPAPERDLENTVANAIFADGAAACLIGLDDNWRHPWIHSFVCEFDPQYIDYLGYRWVDTLHGKRLKVVLHKDVPAIAPIMAEKVVKRLIRPPDLLDLNSIDHFIIHPGGVKVLDNIRDHLRIPESKMGYSREILWEQGNQSSATLGAIGKLASNRALPGDWGLILTLGAGFATYGVLLRWGGR